MRHKEISMTDNNLQILWVPVFRDNVTTSFDRLTQEDVALIGGNAGVFLQVLQERYGYSPSEAQDAMSTFINRFNSFDNSHAGVVASTQTVPESETPSH
jgi:hypothetical protein